MRILIVGSLGGQLSAATKIAMDRGAKVAHVDTIDQATAYLRAGRGADILMVDVNLDVAALIAANEAERITVPVIACGVNVRPDIAAGAIKAGAKEFIRCRPTPS
jgi:two-component system response regulator FlrC